MNRIAWRLMPLLTLSYLAAYIDRQNVAYAKLQMLDSLHLSEVAYGFGASLFFIGYLIFEIPSNIALYRFGARRWIARIMLTWGAITVIMAWTNSTTMFYVLRFLLGSAEAGLYPGVLFYLTLWFPRRHRVRAIGYFTLGSSMANMVGSLMGGIFLDLNGTFGLAGWQWVFLGTGILPLLLTVLTLRFLPDSPAVANFLSPAERDIVTEALRRDAPALPVHANPLAAFAQPRTFAMAFFFLMVPTSIYGIGYWLPTVVKGFGVTSTVNGLLNMIPWGVTSIVLLWLPGRLTNDRAVLRCIGVSVVLGMACFGLSVWSVVPAIRLAALTVGAPCLYILIPCFWTLPARLMSGVQAAAGIAGINAMANLGGFVAQNAMPWVQKTTGSTAAPMLVPAACLFIFGIGAIIAAKVFGQHRDAIT